MKGVNSMKKPNVSKLLKKGQIFFVKHEPGILTGIGIGGMFIAIGFAVSATPKALELMEEKKRQEQIEKLTPIETVKTTWKCYIPAALSAGLSTACLIGANSVSAQRNAALAAAYALSESTLKEYQDKVVETIGEKKELEVRDAIAQDRVDKNPVVNTEVVVTGRGDALCYEPITKRYFYSDIEKIRRIENDLNRDMRDEMYIPFNDWLYELGLSGDDYGDDKGWNIDRGYIETRMVPTIADDGRPCLAIDYVEPPKYDYKKY